MGVFRIGSGKHSPFSFMIAEHGTCAGPGSGQTLPMASARGKIDPHGDVARGDVDDAVILEADGGGAEGLGADAHAAQRSAPHLAASHDD